MKLNKIKIIEPTFFEDKRGYFTEVFRTKKLETLCNTNFVQQNESKSYFGVLRGMHFQAPPFQQSKLIRVIEGEILDVVVDLRKSSQDYGKHQKFLLNSSNRHQLFIPSGFAHGFIVKSKIAIVNYLLDNYYNPKYENQLYWDDPFLNIDWEINKSDIIVSKKDSRISNFTKFKSPF